MDIQSSHPAGNQHNNLNVDGDVHKNIYDQQQHSLNQHNNTHIHHQQPIQQQNHDPHLRRPPEQPQQGQSTENISQANNPIPLRNIKVDPETLLQPGHENDQHIPMENNPRSQHLRDGNFEPDIDLGNVVGSQGCGDEGSGSNIASNFNSDLKKTAPNLNLKNEVIGDFNAFHEQIQTVDPLLLWSMVRSRVVPQVSNDTLQRCLSWVNSTSRVVLLYNL